MKNWILFVFISLLGFGCANKCEEDYEGFISFLGSEDAKMLQILNHSFDTLLQSTYPDIPDPQDRIYAFLDFYEKELNYPLQFSDSLKFRELKTQLEASGFRKSVYIYRGENDDQKYDLSEFIPEGEPEPAVICSPIDIDLIDEEILPKNEVRGYDFQENYSDSIYQFEHRPELGFYANDSGKFWYGMGKYSCSKEIIEILDALQNENPISLAVVAGGMRETDLNNPFIRQAVMAEFYIPAILRLGYHEETK